MPGSCVRRCRSTSRMAGAKVVGALAPRVLAASAAGRPPSVTRSRPRRSRTGRRPTGTRWPNAGASPRRSSRPTRPPTDAHNKAPEPPWAPRLLSSREVPGVSPGVAAAVLRADRRLVVAVVCEDCGSAGGGCEAARTWVWRATPGPRGRGTPGAIALRLLAVRSYMPLELHSAVVSAVRRLAPSEGRDAAVPPAGVLVSWLGQQGLVELSSHGKSPRPRPSRLRPLG